MIVRFLVGMVDGWNNVELFRDNLRTGVEDVDI